LDYGGEVNVANGTLRDNLMTVEASAASLLRAGEILTLITLDDSTAQGVEVTLYCEQYK
jgi:hypothetical protein